MRAKHGAAVSRDFFSYALGISRLWVPAFLDRAVHLAASLCGADDCSLYLVHENTAPLPERRDQQLLYLAATTRRDRRDRVFAPEFAYCIEPKRYYEAERLARRRKDKVPEYIGVTGWVAAFRRTLRLQDIGDPKERRRVAGRGVPCPVWGDGSSSQQHRRYLAVPLLARGRACGVIRVSAYRPAARPFTSQDQDRLQEFAGRLTRFLAGHGLLTGYLADYFLIAAPADGETLIQRVTEAVPRLFGVDCCSFFQRDSQDRFLLVEAAASPTLDEPDRRHFDEFHKHSLQLRLHYVAGRDSKTGLCIDTQLALLFSRERGTWKERTGSWQGEVGRDSNPRVLGDARGIDKDQLCELHPTRSRSLMLVPVRDNINRASLVGVLRVVSTEDHGLKPSRLAELRQFADDLSVSIGRTTRLQKEAESTQRLNEELRNLRPGETKWGQEAAEIIAESIDAHAVTVFKVHEDGKLRPIPGASHLNSKLLEWDEGPTALRAHHKAYRSFVARLQGVDYTPKDGRTGWVWANRRVLNLKRVDRAIEERRLGVGPSRFRNLCEVKDPGAFLGAPLVLGPQGAVEGVVRAVRSSGSRLGPFTLAHGGILGVCGTILAGLLEAVRRREVVISYDDLFGAYRDAVEIQLRLAHNLVVLALPKGGGDYKDFQSLARRASAGLIIATPDTPSREPSSKVIAQIVRLDSDPLRDRVCVLKHQDAVLGDYAKHLPVIEFADRIETTFAPLGAQLRSWKLI